MLGLKTRLAMSRTLAWVGLQAAPEALGELVRELCAGRVDVIVIVQPDASADDLLLGYRTALDASDGRVILGLATSESVARRARADMVAADAVVTPIRAHEYALTLAVANNRTELDQAANDVNADAMVVTADLVDRAVALALPTARDAKPWFAQVDSVRQARSAVAAGARRLALPAIISQRRLGMSARQFVESYRETLAGPWRDEMQQVTFAALHGGTQLPGRGFVPGRPDAAGASRPAPDAPPAQAQPYHTAADDDDLWDGSAHRERGPDDHW